MANAFDSGVPQKPLNGKAYGSIGHLPLSRVGPGDWHVEREGKVDFLTKFVRLYKTDGKYLPNISGLDPV